MCACANWARTGSLLTNHHPDCPQREKELQHLLESLVEGMNYWASDEDGVHYKAWDAYKAARATLGRPVRDDEEPA